MPGKTVQPFPTEGVEKAECRHSKAGDRSFRCPSCGGIMRRCCTSILGYPHAGDCA